jgi:glycosyltransferase involved in cell wall biosynthesis
MLPRGLGAALRRFEPDVVVSSEYGPATWRAMAWCRRSGRRLVLMTELTPWSDAMLSALQLRVHRLLAPRMDGFVAFSSQGVARLEGLGVDPARVEVSVQSADLEAFTAVARRRDPAARPVRVLTVGRLVPDKNLALLIEVFAECSFDEEEASLEVCGTGPLEGELRALASRLGVPVRFRGYTPPSSLPQVYADADILALVSTYEPFGVTVREAAATGLPVICSARAGAAGDVAVDGENAVVVDPSDRAAVRDALRALVRDGDLRARLSAGSLAVTERHPLEADVEAFERAVLRVSSSTGDQSEREPRSSERRQAPRRDGTT